MTRAAGVLLVALACSACDIGVSPGSPTAAPSASAPALTTTARAVTIAITPNPVVSGASGNPAAPRQAGWQVVLRATGGVGATVNFINATLRDEATGVLADPHGVLSQSASDVLAAAGSNHLSAGGSLVVPQVVTFVLAGGPAAPGRLEVSVQLTDDSGNVVSASADALVE